jgi:hypothetical protein
MSIPKPKPFEYRVEDGRLKLYIRCAVCIKEDRPSPHHYSFVKVIRMADYDALEFFDAEGRHHYHVRQQGYFECTFGHKFQRSNLPHVSCPTCHYDVDMQREVEAEMEVCVPPSKPIDGRKRQ